MACEKYYGWMIRAALGELRPGEEREFRAHAAVCADCRGQWEEETCALSLNADGVLLALGTRVRLGQSLIVRNPETFAETHGYVVSLGRTYGRRREVAIEFAEPTEDFLPIITRAAA